MADLLTLGKANSEVCFQVEEIIDSANWRSVMVLGHARRLAASEEMERVMQLMAKRNPSLTPALNKTDIGAWHRLNNIAVPRPTRCNLRTQDPLGHVPV